MSRLRELECILVKYLGIDVNFLQLIPIAEMEEYVNILRGLLEEERKQLEKIRQEIEQKVKTRKI